MYLHGVHRDNCPLKWMSRDGCCCATVVMGGRRGVHCGEMSGEHSTSFVGELSQRVLSLFVLYFT